ncbi:DNA repair protein RecN [Candidatus Entotheonella serta]|nr:DNA repair protein RecN [Candidatus Entotheonella serta]
MLAQLQIENYALIDRVVVEFGPGLNILTGETGAGKSMIMGALGLVLGQRASTDVIRNSGKPTRVEALFDISECPQLRQLLHMLDLEADDATLLLKRVVHKKGSRCYVNTHLATLTMLQDIGQHLVDILGQHHHHTLIQRDQQLGLLDAFGKLIDEVAELREMYHRYQDLEQEQHRLRQSEQERLQRQDLIEFQLQEIDSATLQVGEEEQLQQERHLLVNAEKLHDLASEAYGALYQNDASALDLLSTALDRLTQLAHLDPQQEALRNALQDSYYILDDAAHSLRDYGEHMDVDPARLQELEDRLALIARLKRKYGNTIEDILKHRDAIAFEQQSWGQHEERLEQLETELNQYRQSLKSLAITLSDKRQQASRRLEQTVQQELQDLNMAHPVFRIQHSLRLSDSGDFAVGTEHVTLTADGIDDITYMFSSNPGQSPKPLARIASGGELSRVMLALKSVLAREDHMPTLIFDEVDAGIGGQTARVVGEKLHRIAHSHQIFCITHLPQIASHGDQHYRVEKSEDVDQTTTQLRPLDFAERIDEIARMTSGDEITEATRRHAEEMLTQHS